MSGEASPRGTWVWSGSLSRTAAARARLNPVMDGDWSDTLAAYAERLHPAAGPNHHVVSALGAWLLVALCVPLADDGAQAELADVLSADPMEAGQFAAELLSQPHLLVAAGAGLWVAPAVTTPAMEQWRDGLPPGVTIGDIPTQETIHAWTKERTLGLIDRFPIQMDPDHVCLLATALATKVSWDVPFEVVDSVALAPSTWAASLGRVLQSPRQDPRHRQVRRRDGPGGHRRRPPRRCPGWPARGLGHGRRPRRSTRRLPGRRPLHGHL